MEKATKLYKHPGGKLRRLGPSQCTERDLMAIIINNGTRRYSAEKIAEKLLDKFGTVYNIQGKMLCELMEVEGIGPTKATQIAAAFELCRRIIKHIEREI